MCGITKLMMDRALVSDAVAMRREHNDAMLRLHIAAERHTIDALELEALALLEMQS